MFDRVVKLIALTLLALFVYFHAQQAEAGRFQMQSLEGATTLEGRV